MNKKGWISALLVLVMVTLGACNSQKKKKSEACQSAEKETITCGITDLEGEWKMVSIEGVNVETEREAFLRFDTEAKKIHGSAGCNVLNSVYELKESDPMAISFKPAQMTMMMCLKMEAENAFRRVSPEIASFTFAETPDGKCCAEGKSTLLLLDKDGKELIKLKRGE